MDADDGSLFYKIYDNYMQYGWSQKFKGGGIHSFRNYKTFVDLGGKDAAGCTPGIAPNLWHNDTMVALSTSSNFQYRQCWSTASHDWDHTQVFNNTIFLKNDELEAELTGCSTAKVQLTLRQAQAEGKDPGTRQVNFWPSDNAMLQWMDDALSL